jgi:hypothetical protein
VAVERAMAVAVARVMAVAVETVVEWWLSGGGVTLAVAVGIAVKWR